MLSKEEIKKILSLIDGEETGHGASLHQLEELRVEVQERAKEMQGVLNFCGNVLRGGFSV